MDYYSILGVSKDASEQDIRKAYKKQSMQHHPDRGGNEEKFKQVNEAYSTLKDPHKRDVYDQQQTGNRQAFNFNSENIHDIFGNMFNNRQMSVQLAVDIMLEDVLQGKNLIITYNTNRQREESVNINIPVGAKHGDQIRFQGLGNEIAPGVRGDLIVNIRIRKHHKFTVDGLNLYYKQDVNCFDLIAGKDIVVETLDRRNLKVNIPAGTQNGKILNLTGQGLPDRMTGRKGNLYLEINAYIPRVKDPALIKEITDIKNKL